MSYKKFVFFINLFFLLGATLLTFFLILAGGKNTGVLKNFYWFQASTSGFNSAPSVTRWYNYNWCGWEIRRAVNCSSKMAAQPFSPRDNFGSSTLMPSTFLNNRNTYYYLSRVGWAMLLIALFFLLITLVSVFASLIRYTRPTATLATAMSWITLFFMTLSACLYTGCYAKAVRAFHHEDRDARLGPKNFGFIWTTVFLLIVNSICTTVMVATYKRNEYIYDRSFASTKTVESQTSTPVPSAYASNRALPPVSAAEVQQPQPRSNGKFFKKFRVKKRTVTNPGDEPDQTQEERIYTEQNVPVVT
ncbi:YNL194C [Saccharomyces arboricola H-6]|uniref:YNL194C n=1 Tax=Saccharomyces arboricola (strain H-6 / AS 2.3317 / CBS 10644) TaxID=1160507 RepID=J8PIW4_SACAR|nr:YNL194C [Saccharomyces arboricola H-6]